MCLLTQTLANDQRNENIMRADAMANNILDKDEAFWRVVSTLNNKHLPVTTNVGGATGHTDIADMWASHFKTLLKIQ